MGSDHATCLFSLFFFGLPEGHSETDENLRETTESDVLFVFVYNETEGMGAGAEGSGRSMGGREGQEREGGEGSSTWTSRLVC